MEHSGWLMAFVIITALALFLQSLAMLGMVVAMRRLHTFMTQAEKNTRESLEKLRNEFGDFIESSREPIKNVVANVSEISTRLRDRTEQIDSVVADLTDRTRLQIIRIDQMVTDMVERAQQTASSVERSVVAPVQEVAAVMKGVRRGLEFLFTRRHSATATDTIQDEQMFI